MQVALRTRTPDGIEVIFSALAYAKILEEHPAVSVPTRRARPESGGRDGTLLDVDAGSGGLGDRLAVLTHHG